MYSGIIKTYDAKKGYGFIVPDDGGHDVFVSKHLLLADLQNTLQAGQACSYDLNIEELKRANLKAIKFTHSLQKSVFLLFGICV